MKRSLNLSTLFLLGALVVIVLAGCGKTGPADELERVRAAKYLFVAVQPVNEPFGFSSGTEIVGLDADLARAIASRIGVSVRWIPKPFEEIFDTLAEKKADMIISVVTITESRRERFAFSEPYFQSGQILAIRKDDEKEIKGLEDLKGKQLGVQDRTVGHDLAQRDPRLKETQVMPYSSLDAALLKLNEREVDGVIGGFPVLVQSVSKSFPNLTVIGRPLDHEQKGVVLRKGEEKLLQVVNETIREMKAQGKLEELGQKWFSDYHRIKELQSQIHGAPLG
ncbi:MAG: amino acid ABC transporter substrate-binding protein [Acidobacteria bacterium]|nr:amino acid ABC transporter substrate-binding protein [Acidobacteriota bacterium]